ncbi:MAG: peptide deformylase [Planctomycetota bacterium]
MPLGRSIVVHPHPVLRKKAKAVERIDDAVREVVADMRRVMAELDGAGLAAPQIGESLRIFIVGARDGSPERVFINPVIEVSGPVEPHSEGCLSLPEIYGDVQRPPKARITAMDLDGTRFTLESDAFEARVWQHEFDHLEGVLIIDRMMPRCRLRNRRALRDLERAGG